MLRRHRDELEFPLARDGVTLPGGEKDAGARLERVHLPVHLDRAPAGGDVEDLLPALRGAPGRASCREADDQQLEHQECGVSPRRTSTRRLESMLPPETTQT